MSRFKKTMVCVIAIFFALCVAIFITERLRGGNNGGDGASEPAQTTSEAAPATAAADKTTTAAAAVSPANEADASPTGAAGVPVFEQAGLRKYGEQVDVAYAGIVDPDVKFAPGQDYTNNIWTKEYGEILGIELKIVWTAENPQEYDEKLRAQISAKDLPDVFECGAAQFRTLVNEGAIQDLTDAYNGYASDLLKENAMADGGAGLEQASVKGRLYGIPAANVELGAYQFLYIREDWREQLNLPEPETMADVETIAKTFAEANPDGEEAYGIGISNQPFEAYFSAKGFFDAYGAHIGQWVEKNGKLEHGVVQPEVKNALSIFNGWYNAGLLDPEFIVKGSYDMSQEAVGGRVGVAAGEWWLTTWPLPDCYRLGQNWKAYYMPFDGANAEKLYSAKEQLGSRYVARAGFGHPEALLKMCNLYQERTMSKKYPAETYSSDGVYNYGALAAFRPETGPDRNHKTQANVTKAIDANDTSFLESEDDWIKYRSVSDFIEGVGLDDPDVFATNFMWWRTYYGPDSIFAMADRIKTDGAYIPDAYYDPPTGTMAGVQTGLQSSAQETINNIIMGVESIDAFDAFAAAWHDNGGDIMTAEANEWFLKK